MTPCSKKKSIELLKVLVGEVKENFNTLAPNGWALSPYFAIFHPTAEQQYQACLVSYKRLSPILGEEEPPNREEFEDDTDPIMVEAELLELLGRVLYELLDNFKIFDSSGCQYEISPGRGCSELISQFLNMHYPLDEKEFNYLDFFRVFNIEDYADTYPILILFLQRLKGIGSDLKFNNSIYSITREPLPNEIVAYKEVFGKLPQFKNKNES